MRGAGLRVEGGGGRQGRSAPRSLAVGLCAAPGWLGRGFAALSGWRHVAQPSRNLLCQPRTGQGASHTAGAQSVFTGLPGQGDYPGPWCYPMAVLVALKLGPAATFWKEFRLGNPQAQASFLSLVVASTRGSKPAQVRPGKPQRVLGF